MVVSKMMNFFLQFDTQFSTHMIIAKVPYFFISAEKFMAHSFIQNPEVRFFSREAGKKKIHFFPKKSSWAIHSILGRVSLFLLKIGLYFFFSAFLGVFSVFFFFPRKFICHSFIRSRGCFFFFPSPKKKKTAFSFIQSIFSKSVVKMNFRREKKKYGTFVLRYIFMKNVNFEVLKNYVVLCHF